MTTSIWWIRRDLRLTDNQALAAALAAAEQLLPVFILDPRLLASSYTGDKRTAFLFDGLRALDADLRTWNSRLLVRTGDPDGERRQRRGRPVPCRVHLGRGAGQAGRPDRRGRQRSGSRLRARRGTS